MVLLQGLSLSDIRSILTKGCSTIQSESFTFICRDDESGKLDEQDRKFVLKQAVSEIFEDINFKLYHDSISANLEVVLVN